MRRFLPIILGLALVFLIGLFVLLGLLDNKQLPGKDLSHLHVSAVPRHIEALKSQDAGQRKSAATNLWQLGPAAREATPTLLLAAKDSDTDVRAAAVKALGRTSQESHDAVPLLIDALHDSQVAVRAAAATSLAETWRLARSGGAGPRRGPGADGRDKAAGGPRSFARLGPPHEALAQKAVPLLTKHLSDPDATMRASAAEALAETGPLAEAAVSDLIRILQTDADRDARLQATLALANIGPGAKAAVPVLVEKLRSERADGVRVNTAVALGMIRSNPEAAVPALVETFLNDSHPDARTAAMGSIGMFGAEGQIAIPLVREAATKPEVQQSTETMERIKRLLSFLEKNRGQTGDAGQAPRSKR